jgi:MFS family permease
VLTSYRKVLAVPGAARLLGSALVARLPQGMASLATLLLVHESTRSYAAAGAAVGAEAGASALAAPVLGRLIDRLGRRRVLVRCAAAYASALVLLVVAAQAHAGAVVLVALAFAAGALFPPIAPAVRALLSDVFEDMRARESAYALESVAQELVWIAGPLLVAAVITVFSPAAALLLVGFVSASGTVLFVRAPLAHDVVRAEPAHRRSAVLTNHALRWMLGPIALTGLGLGATEVGIPALALHAGSRSATGLLLALWSVGSMTGGLWFGARSWSLSLSGRYTVLLGVAVLCTAPFMVARSIGAGVVCSLLAGVTIAPVFSCQYALVGHAVTPGTETEAFTWVSASLVAGIAIGSAAGGALVSAAGYHASFVLACAAMAMAATMALAARYTAARGAVATEHAHH